MRSPFTVEQYTPLFVALWITPFMMLFITLGVLTDSRWYWLALIAGIHLWQSGLVASWPAWRRLRGPHQHY